MPIEAAVTKMAFINVAYAPIRLAILTGFVAAGVRLLQFIFLNKGKTECRMFPLLGKQKQRENGFKKKEERKLILLIFKHSWLYYLSVAKRK